MRLWSKKNGDSIAIIAIRTIEMRYQNKGGKVYTVMAYVEIIERAARFCNWKNLIAHFQATGRVAPKETIFGA